MNTPIMPQLTSVSLNSPVGARSSDVAETAAGESFGQALARATEMKPRPNAAGRSDEPQQARDHESGDDDARAGEAARADRADEATSAPAPRSTSARRQAAPEDSESPPAEAAVAADAALEISPPTMPAVAPSIVAPAAASVSDATSAASVSDAPQLSTPTTMPIETATRLSQASVRGGQVAEQVNGPATAAATNVEDVALAQGPQAARGLPAAGGAATASAIASLPADPHAAIGETAGLADDAAAMNARLAAAMVENVDSRRPTRDGTRPAPAPTAQPQRAPIAEALAALMARPAEAEAGARDFAGERGFEQLLGARALTPPRAEPTAQVGAFAQLLGNPSTPTTMDVVSTPVGQPGFAQDVGNRLLLLTTGQVKSAELALTPADLGPVRVSIEVRGQDASIAFVATAAAARAALEEALPRLREMFAQQGLNLLDASVGAQVGQHGQRNHDGASAVRRLGGDVGDAVVPTDAIVGTLPAAGSRPLRLIDVIV